MSNRYEITINRNKSKRCADLTLDKCGDGAYLRINGFGVMHIDATGDIRIFSKSGGTLFSTTLGQLNGGHHMM